MPRIERIITVAAIAAAPRGGLAVRCWSPWH
jgi:hypothetical protein